MEPNIKTIGFEANPGYLAKLGDKLFNLTDICPYDSALNITIVKKAMQYEFFIHLNFVGGKMETESYGDDLDKVTKKGLDKLYDRICHWHTKRFEGELDDGPCVLIVDDDPMSTQFLDHCLKQSGCRTHIVSNGHEAVEEITARQYDLMFLDWNMPGMNGAETLLCAQNRISYDSHLNSRLLNLRMPVITFSGQSRKDIQLPECRHFRLVDHWDKSTPLHQLLSQASDVLFRFGKGGTNPYKT